MQRLKSRDPASKTWEEKNVRYLMDMQKKKEQVGARKDRFLNSVDQRKLETLSTVKGHGRTRAAKALWFTKGTTEEAEAWMEEHAGDEGIDKLTDDFLDSVMAADVVMTDANADVVMEDVPDDRKVGDPNPPEIKEKINQELLKQVMEMGFSEVRAEKALYKVDNASLEHAVNWLGDHGEDADIDLPLRKPPPPVPVKPKMSKEEAEAKAQALQKKLSLKKAQEEKLSDKEKERMRVESTKMMLEANEKLKDEERKRAIQQQLREKEETERDRVRLKEQMRLDYIDRFGKEPPPEEENPQVQIKEKSSKDQVAYFLSSLKKKYKKLKLDNKAFQTRIVPFEGAIELLDVLGFEKKEAEGVLEQRKSAPDGWLCGNALKFIDLILSTI